MHPLKRVNIVCFAIAAVFALVMAASVCMTAASIAGKGVSEAQARDGGPNPQYLRHGWK